MFKVQLSRPGLRIILVTTTLNDQVLKDGYSLLGHESPLDRVQSVV